jgi:hypothetical protein
MAAVLPLPTIIRFRSGGNDQTGELLSVTTENPANPMLRPHATFRVRQSEWRWVPDIECWTDGYGRLLWRHAMAHKLFHREFTVYESQVIEIAEGEQVIRFQT